MPNLRGKKVEIMALANFLEQGMQFQVFDLADEAPDKVLSRIYSNLESLKLRNDQFAIRTMEKLRIIVS